MSYKNQVIKFIEKNYDFTIELCESSSFRRKDSVLIHTYPTSAGMYWRTFYSLDSNKNIIKELKTEEKSVCIPGDTWTLFEG